MQEHLLKSLRIVERSDKLIKIEWVSPIYDINTNLLINKIYNEEIKSIKQSEISGKCMYELIYEFAIPKWKKYLKMKSERNINPHVKLRPDTLWKKILRDVREFFRILFRVRFYFLDYRNARGAAMWVQILFEELGIPLTDDEIKDHKLFRFIHQTHKSKFGVYKELVESPYEVIEKFNELYKKLFMTNLTWARLFFFVYQNFLEEYSTQVKSWYKKEVITMICMILNCYKRMSSYHHIKRI